MRKTTTALKQVPSKIILSTLFAILQNKVPNKKFQKSKLTYLISSLCLNDFQLFDIMKYLILWDFKQSVLWSLYGTYFHALLLFPMFFMFVRFLLNALTVTIFSLQYWNKRIFCKTLPWIAIKLLVGSNCIN